MLIKHRQLAGQRSVWLLLLVVALLTGCGALQKADDAKESLFDAIFTAEIRTLHLDFSARAQLNPMDHDEASSVVLRVYQLADVNGFMQADYQTLLENDKQTLASDLLAMDEILLRPSSSIGLSVPLAKEAKYIGVAAFFRSPDEQQNTWRIVIERDELNHSTAKLLVANRNYLGLSPEPIKRQVTSSVNRNDNSNNRSR